MSRTFASNSGSVENLNVPERCGWIPKCCHTRATVACETGLPSRRNRAASNRLDQCVIPSSAGGSVSVIDRISSRTARGMVGGFPDRGSSASPAMPCSANRDRHGSPSAPSNRPARRSPARHPIRRQQHDPSPLHHPRRRPLAAPAAAAQPAAHRSQQRPHPVGHTSLSRHQH